MNDETEPEADVHIRALLADLGSGPDGESMPPEVAARLEDTLARLVAERGDGQAEVVSDEPGKHDTVLPLRRRRLTRASAAAAAIVVLGAGGLAAADLGVFGGNDSSSSFDSSAGSGAGSGEAKTAERAPGVGSISPTPVAGGDTAAARALPALHATSFASDVDSLLRSTRPLLGSPERPVLPGARAGSAGGSPAPLEQKGAQRSPACPGPEVSDGAVLNPVRYDGAPAVLVVHPERGGRRLVEAWSCTGRRRLAATTLTP